MKRHNAYFKQLIQRQNHLKETILGFFLIFASYARLLLEVFIRTKFGERYFNLGTAITLAAILAAYPFFDYYILGWGNIEESLISALFPYITWFIFLALFVATSLKHEKTIKRSRSTFEFQRYSLYAGKVHSYFKHVKINGKPADLRTIETFLEPAPFFIGGLVLWLVFKQPVGALLTICALFYSMSYRASYYIGDNFVLDKIDEMILNRELEKVFVNDAEPEDASDVTFPYRKPTDTNMRREILPYLQGDEEIVEAR